MSNTFFSENRVFYDVMLKNMVERDRPQMTIYFHVINIRRTSVRRWKKTFRKGVVFLTFPPSRKVSVPSLIILIFLATLVLFLMTLAFEIVCKGLNLTNIVRLWFVNPSLADREN
jgi:hypothetical protein